MRFVRTRRYLKDMDRLGAKAADMERLEADLARNPEAGDVVQGLRGLRKIRFRLGNRGKSGGGRAIYYLVVARDTAVLILAYAKAEQADLTPAQRKAALAFLEELDDGDEA